jgi:hypothetical protein
MMRSLLQSKHPKTRLFKPLLWVGADHDTEQSNRHAANAAVGVELETVANGMAE